jgi:phosphatidate phosphatase APP1
VNKAETKYIILPFIVLYIDHTIWLEGSIYKTRKSLFIIKQKERYWRNILRVMNSYLLGSTRRLHLEIRFNHQSFKVRTNKWGQFNLSIRCNACDEPDLRQLQVFFLIKRQKIKIDIPEPFNHCFYSYQHVNTAVISDIDDTVLVTHTTNTLRKIKTLLIKNALKRKAVKEMSEFYRLFRERGFPFFYVSNSESNLFPMIRLFLEHNHFPIGPIFLKPFVKWNQIFKKRKKPLRDRHKKEKIQFLLDQFPFINFILIGDDSQRDPEIYADIAQRYAGRIREIYIRSVKNKVSKKRNRLQSQIEQNQTAKFVFFNDPQQIINTSNA